MNQDRQTQQLQFSEQERAAFAALPETADIGAAYDLYVDVDAAARDLDRQAVLKMNSTLGADKGQALYMYRNAQILSGTSKVLLLHALENWPVKAKDTSNYTHDE